MSSFVGPFVLDPRQVIKKQIGNQIYHFTPGEDHESSHLQIFRNGKLIREHKNSGPIPTDVQIAKGV